jgi:ResB-like family
MSNISIQPSANPAPLAVPTEPATPPTKPKVRRQSLGVRVLKELAGLRITVVLFILSLILVFVGTLAQMDAGIHDVVPTYFRSLFVMVPFQVFTRFAQKFFWLDKDAVLPGAFPFPGGLALGTALLINLLAAHMVRFKLSWKRSGIIMIHSGLILMMLGELITGQFAIEGNLTIVEGSSTNYLEHRDRCELALTATSEGKPKEDDVFVVPGSLLRQEGKLIIDARPPSKEGVKLLPVNVRAVRFMPNSQLRVLDGSRQKALVQRFTDWEKFMPAVDELPPPNEHPAKTTGLGEEIAAVNTPPGVGVDPDSKFDVPSAYVTFEKDGKELGTYLVSVWFSMLDYQPQKITVDGKNYEISLRATRTYKPYHMLLHKVTTKYYEGSKKPKEYESRVQLIDKANETDRTITISMNQPLRYRGETFYQSGVNGPSTILQVVRNPGWMLPYLSCLLVGLGMLIHFTMNLTKFLDQRAAS